MGVGLQHMGNQTGDRTGHSTDEAPAAHDPLEHTNRGDCNQHTNHLAGVFFERRILFLDIWKVNEESNAGANHKTDVGGKYAGKQGRQNNNR